MPHCPAGTAENSERTAIIVPHALKSIRLSHSGENRTAVSVSEPANVTNGTRLVNRTPGGFVPASERSAGERSFGAGYTGLTRIVADSHAERTRSGLKDRFGNVMAVGAMMKHCVKIHQAI